jgi:hypothetical protein
MTEKQEYTEAVEPKEFLKLMEHELTKFGSYKNIKTVLSKYMMGQVPDEQLQKIGVILVAEMRAVTSKLVDEFDGEPNEARAKFLKRVRRIKSDFENNLMGEIMTSDEKEVEIELIGHTSEGKEIQTVELKKNKV